MELVRYFVVSKYGGFYIDLDMFCRKSLNPLCNNEYFIHTHFGRKWKGGGQGTCPKRESRGTPKWFQMFSNRKL